VKRRTFIKHTGAAGLIIFVNSSEAFQSANQIDDVALERNFLHPPSSAYPLTYWFWMNGNVSKEGITLDLEAMKRIGVAGVFNYDVGTGIPKGPIEYLSNEWLELKKHAMREAARLGLEFTMHNCPGWSASGGPWITPELSMQQVTWSESYVGGGKQISQLLPLPAQRYHYYRDIAVIAFPSLEGEELLQDVKLKTNKVPLSNSQLLSSADGVTVNVDPDTKQASLQFEFSQPYEARAISFFISAIPIEGALTRPLDFGERTSVDLESSNDGIQFSRVVSINTGLDTELLLGNKYITFDFTTTRAKYFRLISNAPRKYKQVQFSGFTRLKNWMEKTNARGRNAVLVEDASTIETNNNQTVSPGFIIQPDAVIDLSRYLDKNGMLNWNVPTGNWTILRIGFTPNGTLNKAAPDTGIGLECDKFNPAAIRFHFNKMMEKLLPVAKESKTKVGLSIDSYEAGGQNWTAGFEKKFQERFQYDIKKYIAAFAGGRIIGSVDLTERFLWDVRRLQADLMAENYYGAFTQLCHGNNLRSYLEPYESGPMEEMQIGEKGDAVMGEFWSSFSFITPVKPTALRTSKLAATITHVNGKKVAGAEAFTAEPEAARWQEYPFYLKAAGDKAFTTGINRFVIHRFAHQPHPTAVPGMSMGPWGIHFDRTNTWWNRCDEWMKYLARCQYLLQQGQQVADLLYFSGDDANMFTKVQREDLHPQPIDGYDYDLVNTDIIMNHIRISSNKIILSSGMSYRVFVLQDYKAIPLSLLKKIYQLVQDGMIMVGKKPERSTGLVDAKEGDAEFKKITSALWGSDDIVDRKIGNGRVFWGQPFNSILHTVGVSRDFTIVGNTRILFVHRKLANADVYFLSNQKREFQKVTCLFRVKNKKPEWWDPTTGKTTLLPFYYSHEDHVQIPIQFAPGGSMFVVFRNVATSTRLDVVEKDGQEIINTKLHMQEGELMSVGSTFSIAFWAKPDINILLNPNFVIGSISEPWTDYYAIYPQDGTKFFGSEHTCCGLAVGRNGVAVWENVNGLPELVMPVAIPISSWTHIALVYQDNSPSVFVNGEFISKGTKSKYAVHAMRTPLPQPGDASFYNGDMDEPDFFNEALDPTKIKSLSKERRRSGREGLPITLASGNKPAIFIHANGKYKFAKSNGSIFAQEIDTLPGVIELNKDWNIQFPPATGAPLKVELAELISLHLHSDQGVKYFSGTATYTKNFPMRKGDLTNLHWFLDLGEVAVIANVKLNNKSFGNLWTRPYRVDVTDSLREGNNLLEIEVTNQWVNRLIGDEQLPDPYKFTPGGGSSGLESVTKGSIEQLPDWYVKGQPKPNDGRVTFTTWKQYRKDSPLIQSGLVGPVVLHPAVHLTIPV
jgi:hypothetical protein